MIKKIISGFFWIVILILAAIWLVDFIKVQNEKEPIFCLEEKVHEFEDGKVTECVGLGYKVYNYERKSINGIQFGSFFTKMKEKTE